MYCQTSSSVQFDSGNTRTLSPGWPCARCRAATAPAAAAWGPSGAAAERIENTRSLARDFSSSRRAPPKARSKPYLSSACFRPSVFHMSVCTADPWSNGLMPSRTHSGFWCTSRSMTVLGDDLVAELVHLPELPGGVDVQQRERRLRRGRRPSAPGAASPSCPCRSSTASPGFSHSATASRMMWMLSASRRCRWVLVVIPTSSDSSRVCTT